MSEMELKNIVGFKAVDKDGNEQNVTVDEIVDMVATRMVSALSETSALSEISTFAAAAATGNDVYENELPTVTDASNVRVLQSNGNAAQMTMQSLATKLGGLIGIKECFRSIGNLNGSANDVTENGSWYCVYNDGIPIPEARFIGILVQFAGGTLRFQFFCSHTKRLFWRVYHLTWSEWKEL